MGYKVAVVGATGNVGREMLNILDERKFPADEVVALASRRSMGVEVSYGDRILKVKALEHYDFSDVDICLMSAGGEVSKEWSPKIGAAGTVVIDNSSAWRMDPDVPLIVPEVNADATAGFKKKNIIANPNCSTAQLVVALKPLHDKATIKRVVVSTYQSVSGAGKDAMDELFSQTKAVYTNQELVNKKFPTRIAFNVIPQIDVFMEDGYTKEEWKMMAETKKILDPKIKLSATCVRVPVFVGHSEAVNIEFENPITADEARDILRKAPGCLVIDKHEPGGYATPYEAAGEDATYIRPHPRGRDGGERSRAVVRVGQSAQGRRAQCDSDRRSPDQPQADQREEKGGVSAGSHHLSKMTKEVVGTLRFAHPTKGDFKPRFARS
ncbi:aspartate-semialdehyde dehydrogenase [Bradyrhizobium sp. LM2.9]